jgi:hypothetical protein
MLSVVFSYCCAVFRYAYPSEARFSCITLELAPVLQANIRLGWKSLPGTNTLAYQGN